MEDECVCVCVRERERERQRKELVKVKVSIRTQIGRFISVSRLTTAAADETLTNKLFDTAQISSRGRAWRPPCAGTHSGASLFPRRNTAGES